MGCFMTKVRLSKQDEQFLLENTQFNKQQIEIWFTGFKKDCPSGINEYLINYHFSFNTFV